MISVISSLSSKLSSGPSPNIESKYRSTNFSQSALVYNHGSLLITRSQAIFISLLACWGLCSINFPKRTRGNSCCTFLFILSYEAASFNCPALLLSTYSLPSITEEAFSTLAVKDMLLSSFFLLNERFSIYLKQTYYLSRSSFSME